MGSVTHQLLWGKYEIQHPPHEREREIYFTPARPGCGHPPRAACRSVCEASLKCRPVGLSIYQFYSYLYRDTFVSKALNIERTSR